MYGRRVKKLSVLLSLHQDQGQRGVYPKIVQERLGHSSITVTLDRYSHIITSLQEAAAVEINDLFKAEGQ